MKHKLLHVAVELLKPYIPDILPTFEQGGVSLTCETAPGQTITFTTIEEVCDFVADRSAQICAKELHP